MVKINTTRGSDNRTFNDAAQVSLDQCLDSLVKQYDTLTARDPDSKEQYRRQQAILELRNQRAKTQYVTGHFKYGRNPILISIQSRYSEYTNSRFDDERLHIAEWYADDWKSYLEEYHQHRSGIDDGSDKVLKWSRTRVAEFLVEQLAYSAIEHMHEERVQALNLMPYPSMTVATKGNRNSIGMENTRKTVEQSAPSTRTTARTDDNAVIAIEKKVVATMLLHIMMHVGFTLDEINIRRLAQLMSHLQGDDSKKSVNANVQTINSVSLDFQEKRSKRHINDLEKLRQWLNHFITKGGDKNSFIAHIKSEIEARRE